MLLLQWKRNFVLSNYEDVQEGWRKEKRLGVMRQCRDDEWVVSTYVRRTDTTTFRNGSTPSTNIR
jgi:hypothetical protein